MRLRVVRAGLHGRTGGKRDPPVRSHSRKGNTRCGGKYATTGKKGNQGERCREGLQSGFRAPNRGAGGGPFILQSGQEPVGVFLRMTNWWEREVCDWLEDLSGLPALGTEMGWVVVVE